jgi:hypothetical protein
MGNFGGSSEDNCCNNIEAKKPVLYLYPEEIVEIEIKLNFQNTKLSCIYPKFNASQNTWKVKAFPNGEISIGEKKYPYLFWEAYSYNKRDLTKGFIVKAEEAETFLEEKLKILGLNEKESCDFITFWLPVFIRNKISLCSFQTKEFFDCFQYNITPKPKSFIRVFCLIKKLDKEIKVEEQELKEIKREGFTVVEWGGSQVNN